MTTTISIDRIQADPTLVDAVAPLLSNHREDPAEQIWQRLTALGMHEVGSEAHGSGGPLDACGLLDLAGYHALSLPLIESGLTSGWIIGQAGLDLDSAAVTISPDVRHLSREQLAESVTFGRVPWVSPERTILVTYTSDDTEYVAALKPEDYAAVTTTNLGGETRSAITVDGPTVISWATALPAGTLATLAARGSLGVAAQIGGSLRRSVEFAAEHARSRTQFGKAIGKFQAVAHLLAVAAEHVALTQAAVGVAAHALETDASDPMRSVAAARVAAHQAVKIISANTHQVLGAMGVTEECELSSHTVRQLAWTNEWGLAKQHASTLTSSYLDRGDLWESLTETSLEQQGQTHA